MPPEIKKNVLGVYQIKFDCPKCGERLTCPLSDAGNVDQCPSCLVKFKVPGSKQYQALKQKRENEKEAKRIAKKEAAETRKREAQERREAAEQERERQNQLIERQDTPPELPVSQTHRPPSLPAELTQSMPMTGQISNYAECPFCAELIMANARKCKHCGELLDPVLRAADESRRASATPQIVNVVHGSTATAVASADAESSSSISSGCGGCLTLILLFFLIAACAGALGGP